ncbi:MAG: hypothetical protein C0391_03080 [Anaerolinea sp.]|nr:hypothetical protein [Anaerolinea sp.]
MGEEANKPVFSHGRMMKLVGSWKRRMMSVIQLRKTPMTAISQIALKRGRNFCRITNPAEVRKSKAEGAIMNMD